MSTTTTPGSAPSDGRSALMALLAEITDVEHIDGWYVVAADPDEPPVLHYLPRGSRAMHQVRLSASQAAQVVSASLADAPDSDAQSPRGLRSDVTGGSQ
jgi:hypothetical protein